MSCKNYNHIIQLMSSLNLEIPRKNIDLAQFNQRLLQLEKYLNAAAKYDINAENIDCFYRHFNFGDRGIKIDKIMLMDGGKGVDKETRLKIKYLEILTRFSNTVLEKIKKYS